MSLVMEKLSSSQVKLKLAYSAKGTSLRLDIWEISKSEIILSMQ